MKQRAILFIGHGGIPKDYDYAKVKRLKELERTRSRLRSPMSEEEKQIDAEIRHWPRTAENDPFKAGFEDIVRALQSKRNEAIFTAYNEFCTPSIEEAIEKLAQDGIKEIVLLTSMFTRGGIHSDGEIPEIVEKLRPKFPHLRLNYAWPFDSDLVAQFLSKQIDNFSANCESTSEKYDFIS